MRTRRPGNSTAGRWGEVLQTFDRGVAAVARQSPVACLIVCISWLGGCVVGQSVPVGYTPTPSTTTATGVAVAVTVRDERPYVTSGDKPAYFLGAYRAAIGVPWDVTTKGKQPLAALFETHLAVELRSLGYAVVPRPDRRVRERHPEARSRKSGYIGGSRRWDCCTVTVTSARHTAQRLKLRSERVVKDAGAGVVSGGDMLFSP